MKKIFHFVVYVLVTMQCWCYPSFVAPSGQTIYYQIVDGSVQIVSHNSYYYLTGNLIIPDSISDYGTRYAVTSIGNSAFQYCAGLTSVSFPATITHIGDYAFYHCGALSSCSFAGDSVLIGQSAFQSSGLVSLYFSNTFVSISQYAFGDCDSLTTVNIAKGSIGQGAFQNCVNLVNVSIDSCIVGSSAFRYCYSLSSVLFGNGVYSIGNYAFSKDTSLSSIYIPDGITYIGNSAFYECSGLTSAIIGNGITIISQLTFAGCSSLYSVQLPNGITTINNGAFYGCSGLSHITIPNSCSCIGDDAFAGCNFNNVIIPDSVVTIGYNAFRGSGLNTVTIGENVGWIGGGAFDIWGLDTVFLKPTIPPVLNETSDNRAFGENTTGGRIFILSGCTYDDYIYSWYYYSSYIQEPIVSFVVSLSSNQGEAIVIQQRNRDVRCDSTTVIQANSGLYHFDHWSNGNTANPDTLHLSRDTSVMAFFIGCTLNTNNDGGTATHCKIGDHIDEIQATAEYGYHFDHWSTGSTSNPDTIYLTGDTTITAYFERNQYSLTTMVNDSTLGYVSFPNGDTALYGNRVVVVAHPIEHYHVDRWMWMGMTIYGFIGYETLQNGGDTLRYQLYTDDTVVCYFTIDEYTITVEPNDNSRGTVTGGGVFEYGTPCIVQAYPYSGYTFDHWSNGVTDNPYAFPATEDVELTAIFLAEGEAGINNTTDERIWVYSSGGRIVVEGTTDEVRVFDMVGHNVRNETLPAGVYMVKIGNYPARKVVVK